MSSEKKPTMTASKHTPGPWAVQRYVVDRDGREVGAWERGNLSERCRVVADGSPMVVADMVAGGSADARLIAAAPELYSSLCAAVEYAPHGETCTEGECRCWQRYARAAIAKATGGEP